MNSADQSLLELARLLREENYSHTTATPKTHALVNARPGNEWAKDARGVFGWSRPFRGEVLSPQIFEAAQRAQILDSHGEAFRSKVRLSSLNDQLFFHSAFPTDDANAVFFGPDTYRFVSAINAHLNGGQLKGGRAVDIGCGAGPGAISVALARPEVSVFALDINDHALRLARLNAQLAGAANVETRNSNLLRDVDGDFDLIVANPPYLVDPGERAYRHGGGPLGAGLSLAIVEAGLKRLCPGGTLLLYTGAAMIGGQDPFLEALQPLLSSAQLMWDYREVDPDIFGEELEGGAYAEADRIAAVVLTAKRPA